MTSELITALKEHQDAFGLDLSESALADLEQFYAIVQEHNPLLHLVGPCSPEEFAVRHVLESLTILELLPEGTTFADIGAGAGLPSIPCLIVREDLKGVLFESKVKKSAFLTEAVGRLGIAERAEVVNKQFAEAPGPAASVVCCRALDKFTIVLPRLLKWTGRRGTLLFGGPGLREALRKNGKRFTEKLMPMSEQRYLFIIEAGK